MSSFNRVILLGNLTRDPEIRHTASGTAVTDIGLAVNDKRKAADGQWVDEVTFVDVTLWGRTAEVAGEYLTKGSPVLIEGRLKLDSWTGNDGAKRSKLKVVGERLQMIGNGKAKPAQANRQPERPEADPYNEPEPAYQGAGGGVPEDEIPF